MHQEWECDRRGWMTMLNIHQSYLPHPLYQFYTLFFVFGATSYFSTNLDFPHHKFRIFAHLKVLKFVVLVLHDGLLLVVQLLLAPLLFNYGLIFVVFFKTDIILFLGRFSIVLLKMGSYH